MKPLNNPYHNENYNRLFSPNSRERILGKELSLYVCMEAATADCYGAAKAAGWWNDLATGEPLERNVGEMLALIHSEISEALEAHRKSLMDDKLPKRLGMEVELADALIRIFDLAGALELDLGGAMVEKMRFNAVRADHKPENRAKADGKKY